MAAASYDASPVLIVGAGPTGLAAAMSLARAHIPVRLIDKALQPDPHSRAIGIQARTLELLEQHRLVEPFLALGHRARAANLYSNGQRLARLDFDPLQTRYPYVLFLDRGARLPRRQRARRFDRRQIPSDSIRRPLSHNVGDEP